MSETNNHVEIIEKPDYISYKEIKDMVYESHQSNRNKGIVVSTTTLDEEGIENYIGDRGKCLVALVDGKLAGTMSFRVLKRNGWYHKGDTVDEVLAAINPQYRGLHIMTDMRNIIEDETRKLGINVITYDTQEQNTVVLNSGKKHGFVPVDYYRSKKNTRHFCVKAAKWLDKQPRPTWAYTLRFRLKRRYVRIMNCFKK